MKIKYKKLLGTIIGIATAGVGSWLVFQSIIAYIPSMTPIIKLVVGAVLIGGSGWLLSKFRLK